MIFGRESPAWAIEGRDWPNRQHSRFVASGGISWHVQEMGEGPALLLLHGTGAATHSFRDLAPELAKRFHVVTLDLPGHGFTTMPSSDGLSLDGMARRVGGVLDAIKFEPALAVGHSAGAAIVIAMALTKALQPKALVSLNGALKPIRGASVFSPLAKLLFLNPLAPKLFSWRALNSQATRRLLEGTGSRIDQRGVELYERLFRKSGHVAATLGMMANWNLTHLESAVSGIAVPLLLVTAANDRAIPSSDATAIAARLRSARVLALDYGGHLVHEEEPALLADLVGAFAEEAGVFAPSGQNELSNTYD